MFDWLRQLDRSGRRTFWACFGGYALDAMDVQMFSFAMPVLIGLWGLSNSDAGILASVTLIFSAIGGWGAGLLADRIGRGPHARLTREHAEGLDRRVLELDGHDCAHCAE